MDTGNGQDGLELNAAGGVPLAPPAGGLPGGPQGADAASPAVPQADQGAEALVPDRVGERAYAPARRWVPQSVARGFALFFGLFTLLNLAGALHAPAFDENLWWVDLRVLPGPLADVLLAAVGVALVAWAVVPAMRAWRRWTTFALVLAFAAAAVYNGVDFYFLWSRGELRPGVPFPLSLAIAAVLVFIALAAALPTARAHHRWPVAVLLAGTVAACLVLFPLAQVFFFGTSDYRRKADAVVVFGAQVHPGPRPSFSLIDRVDTAVGLYKGGYVGKLVMSGGVGDSGYNEALVMRDMAVERGVPADDLVIDSNGVNTNATVADTVPLFEGAKWKQVLAVSQFYHLPRIKLAYQRAGWDVATVPAKEQRRIGQTPRLVLREVPAFWSYYLRAIIG